MEKIIALGVTFYLGYRWGTMTPEQRQALMSTAITKAQSLANQSLPQAHSTNTPQLTFMNGAKETPAYSY